MDHEDFSAEAVNQRLSAKKNGEPFGSNSSVGLLDDEGWTIFNYPTLDTEQQIKLNKLDRFVQFFNRVNSAICQRPVVVRTAHLDMPAPAWS